jgi:hypothetical protein
LGKPTNNGDGAAQIPTFRLKNAVTIPAVHPEPHSGLRGSTKNQAPSVHQPRRNCEIASNPRSIVCKLVANDIRT